MKSIVRKSYLFVLIVILLVVLIPEVEAQCPMCRMSVESNLKEGGTMGKGLNFGILYLLAMPYLMVGVIGFVWWRNQKQSAELEDEDLIENTFTLN